MKRLDGVPRDPEPPVADAVAAPKRPARPCSAPPRQPAARAERDDARRGPRDARAGVTRWLVKERSRKPR